DQPIRRDERPWVAAIHWQRKEFADDAALVLDINAAAVGRPADDEGILIADLGQRLRIASISREEVNTLAPLPGPRVIAHLARDPRAIRRVGGVRVGRANLPPIDQGRHTVAVRLDRYG